MSRASARLAGRAVSEALQFAIPLPGIGQLASFSAELGQTELERRGIVDVPSVIEFLGPGPGGAFAIDVLGIGEKVSAGDLQRLRTRLHACEGQLRATGQPLALGVLTGAQLATIIDAVTHAQKRSTTVAARRSIVAADAIVRGAGYSGLLDPRMKQAGTGGPNFVKLQKALATFA